ncbi:hypothetical protein GUITHDRAFT_108343 [Guillardia theta CCMP2712]|uniref:HMG box domain-containing protein n=1 Tax=Guillardia theta (strain CCMP2712) TaxID=905079 RepID=L1JC70_GUITC|nr:hypothetical protein GUITHDRAFT_108343 [Guillardia theta CCMP2712]EKX45892.1 hypothetical protein GUITHDRAFT_108343 [Guillardia theta CCMP2712]|eukprot:XP_005832872.1 hypothetical protein GUITHDRAFT_108343 [Guillardia theta CCMP2712]
MKSAFKLKDSASPNAAASPAPPPAAGHSPVPAAEAQTAKRRQQVAGAAPGGKEEVPAPPKRKKTVSTPEIGVLEWLEAEADKRELSSLSYMNLPQGLKAPLRPEAAAVKFLKEVKDRIRHPPNQSWTSKQLAQGVMHLFESLPASQQKVYVVAAKKDMERYKEELAAVRAAIQPRSADGEQQEWNKSKLAHLAYNIYERNSTPKLKLQNATASHAEIVKMCKRDWNNLTDQQRKAYQFLAERDREKTRVQQIISSRNGSDAVTCRYCVFCGSAFNQMDGTKFCRQCGRAIDHNVVAFAPRSRAIDAGESGESHVDIA